MDASLTGYLLPSHGYLHVSRDHFNRTRSSICGLGMQWGRLFQCCVHKTYKEDEFELLIIKSGSTLSLPVKILKERSSPFLFFLLKCFTCQPQANPN